MGFSPVAKHRSKDVTLYRQGDINFILNAEPQLLRRAVRRRARALGAARWPSASSTPSTPTSGAHRLGAKPAETQVGPMELAIPAIEGIGGLQIYLVDRYGDEGLDLRRRFRLDSASATRIRAGVGLHYIDHLTHNVHRGRMNEWADFYERLFNFRQIRYFDIEGKLTGLHSRAMTSPDGKIRIPINEDAGETGQIEEYLQEYNGEGIQHVALGSTRPLRHHRGARGERPRLHAGAERHLLRRIDQRLPRHGEPLDAPEAERHPDRRRGRRRGRLHQGAAAALLARP